MATYRQPRIDTYTGADALRDTGNLIMQLAFRQIDDKKVEERNRVSLAVNRLASLERRRNAAESSFLDKQAAISGYVGESQNLSDIYKTGKDGKLGSSIQDITFDLYDEPFKYHQQAMAVTQNQIDALNPAILSSIDKLAKLSQAEQFLSKGIGATHTTGADEAQKKIWGPEDFSQAAFTEKFYPDLEEGKTIPKELEVFFQRHQPDPLTIADLEAKRLKAEWDIKQRDITKRREEREEELFLYATGEKKKIPTAVEEEANKSLRRLNIYNPMITKASTGMLHAAMGYSKMTGGIRDGKDADARAGQIEFNAETFRIGLIFNPAAARDLGIDQSKIRDMSPIEFQDRYEELLDKKDEDPKRIRAVQIRKLGEEIFHLNDQRLKYDPLDVKNRGVTVPPYNDRDELIARAYKGFRDIRVGVSDEAAGRYADGIDYIFGVNLKAEGTVRGILREYFRTNYLESTIGHTYDKIEQANITSYEDRLAGNFLSLVKHNYYYDITKDRWIDSFIEVADIGSPLKSEKFPQGYKLVPQYE